MLIEKWDRTLKVFEKGVPRDYAGTRQTDGIVSFMKKCVGASPSLCRRC